MFELKQKDVKLTNLTTRTERHGEEDVPAISIKCQLETSNKVLDAFSPKLLPAFYECKEKAQVELIKNDMFPDLKMPEIKPIAWDREYAEYRVLLCKHLSPDEAEHILPDCTLKGFKFELKDGGSVIVSFTINCRPSPEAVAYLYKMQGHDIMVTLEPPKEAQLEEFGEQVGYKAA